MTPRQSISLRSLFRRCVSASRSRAEFAIDDGEQAAEVARADRMSPGQRLPRMIVFGSCDRLCRVTHRASMRKICAYETLPRRFRLPRNGNRNQHLVCVTGMSIAVWSAHRTHRPRLLRLFNRVV